MDTLPRQTIQTQVRVRDIRESSGPPVVDVFAHVAQACRQFATVTHKEKIETNFPLKSRVVPQSART